MKQVKLKSTDKQFAQYVRLYTKNNNNNRLIFIIENEVCTVILKKNIFKCKPKRITEKRI